MNKARHNAYGRMDYACRKAVGICVRCGLVESETGKSRCMECLQRDKLRKVRKPDRSEHWAPPAYLMTAEALYEAVRHEREVVSWCWKHPA